MIAPGASRTSGAKSPGRLTGLIAKWFFRQGTVSKVAALSEHFRLIRIEGEGLREIAWTPGDKVQISMGSGFVNRTYTPLSWNSRNGATEILAYVHGDAPACVWIRGLREGRSVEFFGPRRSLDISDLREPIVLFGDETCFGLAVGLRDMPRGHGARCIFEVSAIAESRSVLAGC